MSTEEKRNQVRFTLPALTLRINKPSDFLRKTLLIVSLGLFITFLSIAPLSEIVGVMEEAAPFPESQYGGGMGALLNLLFYLVLVIGVTLLLLFLLKREKFNIVNILFAGSLGFSGGSIASLVIPVWSYFLITVTGIEIPESITLGIAPCLLYFKFWSVLSWGSFIVFFILPSILLLKPNFRKTRNGVLLLIGAWVGSFMALLGGSTTPLVLMAGFAIYDIVSVFKGPLGEVIKELEKKIPEDSKSKGQNMRGHEDAMLGLGDVVFYGIATSYAWIHLGIIGFIAVVVTILVGLSFTLYFLIRSMRKGNRPALPALPIPLFLALTVILVFKFFPIVQI